MLTNTSLDALLRDHTFVRNNRHYMLYFLGLSDEELTTTLRQLPAARRETLMRDGLVNVLPPAIRDVVLPRDGDGDVGVSNGVFFAHASPMRIGGAAYNVVEQDLVFNTEDEDIQILSENRLVPPSFLVDTTMTPPSTPNAPIGRRLDLPEIFQQLLSRNGKSKRRTNLLTLHFPI